MTLQSKLGTSGDRQFITKAKDIKHIKMVTYLYLGMIQQLRNAVVAATGMGKNYGRIMPLLRLGPAILPFLEKEECSITNYLLRRASDVYPALTRPLKGDGC